MAYIAFEHTRIVASEGGESMAEFQPDPFLTSLGMSVDEQRAYDAYCDAVVDASEAEIARTGVTYTLEEVFDQAHAEIERLKREYPAKIGGGHVPSSRLRPLLDQRAQDSAAALLRRH